jgi:hypothetical protein
MMTKSFPVISTRRTRGGFTRKQRGCSRGPCHAVAFPAGGFTLAELLVSVFVLTLIILMVAQLMTSAAAITRTGSKHIDTDTQARVVLDRMALDFAQMLKRTDIDHYIKQPVGYRGHGHGHGWGHQPPAGELGSDQIAFFSQVPGYYPQTSFQSPISLVAYRLNEDVTSPSYLKLERMGKGLPWNGVSGTNIPMVFLPRTIDETWSTATRTGTDPDYETIGPGVFRFEYYYLLKNGRVTDTPWNTDDPPGHTSLTGIGLGDIEAIVVAIAVIDPAARALIAPDSLLDLASDMFDFKNSPGRGVGGAHRIGDMEDSWKTVVETVVSRGLTSSNSPVPPEAAKAIRIYNRYYGLKTL